MTITSDSFVVVEDTVTLTQALDALQQVEAAGHGRPHYVVVQSHAGQVIGALSGKALEHTDPSTQIAQHPYLNSEVGQVDQHAPEGDRKEAMSRYGLVLVMDQNIPVDLLVPMMYGDEIVRPGLVPILSKVSPQCSKCGKSFKRPRASYVDGQVKFWCPFCDHELARSAE
jgi:Mg/Co/Ni transporter MgtE